ncbi:MAG: hypothetical protein ABJF10_19830 [Chthoniobacter sp.]|uniref:hypothetical protein n=1 Tax=Chthoniobacter sp. TaxID=2510640 RepID=UPI0032A379A9
MAITFEATYAKKLGLPNYSSHQYSVTIRTELSDLSTVEEASTRLYGILQDAVDREIRAVGFMPDASTYGMKPTAEVSNGNGQHAGGNGRSQESRPVANGNGSDRWRCSDKQREFIERIVREKGLDKNEVEHLAVEMFDVGVRQLDKLQASGFIDELLERHGDGRRNGKRGYRPERASAGGGGRQ